MEKIIEKSWISKKKSNIDILYNTTMIGFQKKSWAYIRHMDMFQPFCAEGRSYGWNSKIFVAAYMYLD